MTLVCLRRSAKVLHGWGLCGASAVLREGCSGTWVLHLQSCGMGLGWVWGKTGEVGKGFAWGGAGLEKGQRRPIALGNPRHRRCRRKKNRV